MSSADLKKIFQEHFRTVWNQIRPRDYKTFSIPNSAKHEIYPANEI